MEIALNSGQTATINTNFKAGDITIASGTLSIPTSDLRADKTTTGSGSIKVNSGATLSMGSGSLVRTATASSGYFGSLTVDGTLAFTSTSVGSINANSIAFNGTVQYTSNGAQTFVQKTSGGGGSATPSTYTNLTVSGSGLKTLSTATTVTGTVTLSGTASVALAAYNLTLSGTVPGAGPGTAIATNGTGNLIRSIATGGNFTFPISSDGTGYNPASILLSPLDPPETFSVRVAAGINPSAPYNGAAVRRTWTISEGTPGGNSASVTLQWSGGEEGATFSRATAGIWRYDGSAWMETGFGSTQGSDPYYLTIAGISTFSAFLVGNHPVLPITLRSLSGSPRSDGAVSLVWSTVNEINNYGFYVERASTASGRYQTVSPLIPGHGTTNVPQQYGFVDRSPATGRSWYRLRQIDLDQSVHLSDAIMVSGGPSAAEQAPHEFELAQNYPNPFNPTTTIKYTIGGVIALSEALLSGDFPERSRGVEGRAGTNVRLTVFDILGREVSVLVNERKVAGSYEVKFDASDLPSGVYFYRLQAGSFVQSKRLLLLK